MSQSKEEIKKQLAKLAAASANLQDEIIEAEDKGSKAR